MGREKFCDPLEHNHRPPCYFDARDLLRTFYSWQYDEARAKVTHLLSLMRETEQITKTRKI